MPINGANHKYKSLYKITILTFICLPGPVCVCARVRVCACVCVNEGGQKCVKLKVIGFHFLCH